MNASTSAATVAKSLPAESKAGNFVEQQTPKPTQIQDDAERSRSLVARITSNSIDELEGLMSDLTSGLQKLQEFLKSEGERVQREVVNHAHLNQTALAAIKEVIETTFQLPQVETSRDDI
ncbi:MAG: hypothetical protein WAR76_01915 [Xanthobacteraceae bacterium]|jgi:hypothetical protein